MIPFCLRISLICFAVYELVQPGMLFCFIGNWGERQNHYIAYLLKPVFRCVICMASFWTLIIWNANRLPFSWHLFEAMLIVMGMNLVINSFLNHDLPLPASKGFREIPSVQHYPEQTDDELAETKIGYKK